MLFRSLYLFALRRSELSGLDLERLMRPGSTKPRLILIFSLSTAFGRSSRILPVMRSIRRPSEWLVVKTMKFITRTNHERNIQFGRLAPGGAVRLGDAGCFVGILGLRDLAVSEAVAGGGSSTKTKQP